MQTGKKTDVRLILLLWLCTGFIFLLFIRLIYLQLIMGDYYSGQADGNRLRRTKIVAARGLIYDSRGRELVNNSPGFAIALQKQNTYPTIMLQKLGEVLSIPLDFIQNRIKKNRNYYEPVILRTNITPGMLTKFEESRKDFRDVLLMIHPERRYVYDNFAVHAIGYVGEVSEQDLKKATGPRLTAGSIIGKTGLEKHYDSILRGTDGFTVEEVDVTGAVVQNYDKTAPKPGKNLHLTIDYQMQKRLQDFTVKHLAYLRKSKQAPNAYAAAVVVLDPRNGAVRAMLSTPDYNPNLFITGISDKEWQKINNDPYFPQLNRAVAGEYPPGSTFKIVTGSAAFELNKVKVNELILDRGYHPLVPTMGNANKEVLGKLDFIKGLSMSDNVYFYELANRVGIDAISKYAHVYGFGEPTGIELEEESCGLVASKEVKQKIWHEDWRLGDTFNAAIGQGFNLATPLQLAVMLSSVANGGIRYQPYLVEKITNSDGSLYQIPLRPKPRHIDVSQQTLNYMQKGMSATTKQGGTAAYFRTLPKPIAGKTGTAENPHGRDHGLFVAYGPVNNPELCVVAIVEQGGYGAVSAGPIVYQVFEEYFREKHWLPEQTSKGKKNK